MKRWIFVPNPHVRLDRSWARPYIPLELLSGMAVVEQAGGDPKLFDVNRLVQGGALAIGPDLWRHAARLLSESKPDLVVFETWTGTLHSTLQLLEAARPRLPGVPLMLVGAGTSALASQVVRAFPAADAVLCGEIEPGLELIARHEDWHSREVPGLVSVRSPEPAAPAWVLDLARLPRPAYHLACIEPGDAIPVESGRGCEQSCSFCALAGHWPRRYRAKPAARLAEEMIDLGRRYPGSPLDLTQDPSFFGDRARLTQLCDRLEGASLSWSCHARVDGLDPSDLARLRGAGCRGLLLGIESGCPAIQRSIGKRVALEHIEPTIRSAREIGIEAQATFIVGFPEEDEAAMARTASAMLHARRAGAADTVAHLLRAYPGSAVHERCRTELVYDPLLSAASPGDAPSVDLIRAHPELLTASYRVPGQVPWRQQLSLWLALSAYLDVLDALERHGAELSELLFSLSSAASGPDLGEVVRALGRELGRAGSRVSGVAAHALTDLIDYRQAVYELCQTSTPGESEVGAESPPGPPDAWLPKIVTPWRLLRLLTPIEDIVSLRLDGTRRLHDQWVLLAKVPNPGRVSYYTSRSYSVETFILDRLAATALPLCRGERDLASLARAVADLVGEGRGAALTACRAMLDELTAARVAVLLPATSSAVEAHDIAVARHT